MSSPSQYCNGATLRSRTQFARPWQQLHNFRHWIAEDDSRGPTSAGFKIDEVGPLRSVMGLECGNQGLDPFLTNGTRYRRVLSPATGKIAHFEIYRL